MLHFLEHISEPVKHLIDSLALSTLVAFFLTSFIPAATVALTFIWVLIRVLESWISLKLKYRDLKGPK